MERLKELSKPPARRLSRTSDNESSDVEINARMQRRKVKVRDNGWFQHTLCRPISNDGL